MGFANAVVVLQRQTVVSQFFQLDKLVVEGGKSVSLVLSLYAYDVASLQPRRASRRVIRMILYGRQRSKASGLVGVWGRLCVGFKHKGSRESGMDV